MYRRTIFGALLAAAMSPVAAAAMETPVHAELMPGWRDGARHIAGLRVVLDPGWKTYWRAPGASGIPPMFDWSGSENLQSVEIQFPVPSVFDISGLQTIGYEKEVIFPITLVPGDPGEAITLVGEVELGVCEDVCIPVTFRFAGSLPASGAPDASLVAARADKPRDAGGIACRIEPISDGLRLEADVAMPSMTGPMAVVIETADPSVWVSPPEISVSGGRLTAVVDLVPPDAVPFALERDGLRLTAIGTGEAVEMRGCD